jgi:hypothetical protein
VAGRIRSNEKSNGLIGNQSHYLPACSIVPEPTMLLRAPWKVKLLKIIKLNYCKNYESTGLNKQACIEMNIHL